MKRILLLAFTSVSFFILGYLTYHYARGNQKKNDCPEQTEQIITAKKDSILPDLKIPESAEIDYSKILNGKYILEGADWAGFEFIDAKTISWTNELFPMDPDTMRLDWINKNTFVGTFNRDSDQSRAPNNWIEQIVSFDGNILKMKEINTGWNESEEYIKVFRKNEYR